MRKLVLALAAGAQVLLLACSPGTPTPAKRMVILGFDGMDPVLARRWMREGRLPHLAALAARGGAYTLETTPAPSSASAWASFATGVNPGKHNVFDALARDPATYTPDLGTIRRVPARFLFNWLLVAPPTLASTRAGTSFWVTAGHAGLRSSVLGVPVTFPPEDVPNGELLSGLPLPDIGGTAGTFHYFATDLEPTAREHGALGGVLAPLVFDGRVARAMLVGPADPAGPADPVTVPFTITWNREARSANIDIAGQTIHLRERDWSRWIDVDFRLSPLVRLRGMTQMLLISAGTTLRLYVSPVNWHPADPPAPISSPPSFAADLFERLGPYRTIGWAQAMWPLNDGRIDETTFLDEVDRAFTDRTETILNRVDAGAWDLLVGVVETTDRVQHMMWRLIDPGHPMYDAELARRYGRAIEQAYQRADSFVGEVVSRVGPETAVLVVSDHGFHTFRWAVHLNSWLVERGYMTRREPRRDVPLDGWPGTHSQTLDVDWSRTEAYAVGLGQIYVNLAGREGQGIVAPGAAYDALVDRLASDLTAWLDPRTGAPVVRTVHRKHEIYSGPFADRAADLQVGLAPGYRVSWQTAVGGAPPAVIDVNNQKWSGDHDSLDHTATPGVLVSSVPAVHDRPHLIDIAPSVLRYFGVEPPADLDGRPLFRPGAEFQEPPVSDGRAWRR